MNIVDPNAHQQEPNVGWTCGICGQRVADEAVQERLISYPDGITLIGPVHVHPDGAPVHDLAAAFEQARREQERGES